MRALQNEDDDDFDDSIASNDEVPVPEGVPPPEHPMTLSRLWNSKIVGTEVTVGTICLVLLGLYLLL